MELYEITTEIIDQQAVARNCYLLTLAGPQVAGVARPGQFVMLGCSQGRDPFLRRPLSIHQVDRLHGRVILLYQVRGRGTELLARQKPGTRLPLLGPLGRGFSWTEVNGRGLLVGAGLGAAPLLFLADELSRAGWQVTTLLGARTCKSLLRLESFAAFGEVISATDDGSNGRPGTAVDLLEETLSKREWSQIFACGPVPVLRQIQRLSRERGIPAQISLEERMACGLGACLGCVCRSGSDQGYLRVCKEGPVFEAGEVSFDD